MHECLTGAAAVEWVGVVGGIADDEEVGGEGLAFVIDEATEAVLQAPHR